MLGLSTKTNQVSEAAKVPTAPVNKKIVGFWGVLFMVLGIQFAGMTSGWNGGVDEGIGELLLANFLVGLMYLMLSMCFAELTSIVAFAGGSFGYCRASLGPFWGFMVGASEMLENFLYVIVTVMTIGSACTQIYGTSVSLEPVWYAITYMLLTGVHLRGGALFWYIVIISGAITLISVTLYCLGQMTTISVVKWGMPDGKVFKGSPLHFMEAMFFPTWFYIGLELAPQTCERVKDVNINLPRGMIIGNSISIAVSFWVIFAATCNFPGFNHKLAQELFPLRFGYTRIFHAPSSLGAILALIPSISAAIGFMWGCGYQVASLARSGLLPSICARTYGAQETPYWSLSVSSVLQLIVCVLLWWLAPQVGPHVLYETVVIGASIVYIGMFSAFIVFRIRFGAMKRQWESRAGIPGAMFGILVATTLFVSAVAFQKSTVALIIYAVYMTLAAGYYMCYAQRTQFFSAEEQKKFMKAYILNANKKNRNNKKMMKKSAWQKFLDSYILPWLKWIAWFESSGSSAAPSRETSVHSVTTSKRSEEQSLSYAHNSHTKEVTPELSNAANKDSSTSAPTETTLLQNYKRASVLPLADGNEPTSIMLPGHSLSIDLEMGDNQMPTKDTSIRIPENAVPHSVRISPAPHQEVVPHQPSTTAEKARFGTRASWSMNQSLKVGWSGKIMTMSESKKFFDVLTSSNNVDDAAQQLILSLPNQFQLVPASQPSDDANPTLTASTKDEDGNNSVFLEVEDYGNFFPRNISSTFLVEKS